MKKHNVYLLQGSNKENKKKYLDESLFLISKKIGEIIKKSSYFESIAWNMNKNTSFFYNRALHIKTFHSPIELLEKILNIEFLIGRKSTCSSSRSTTTHCNPKNRLYQDREIDIDILFYDHLIIQSSMLTIPHPLFHFRRFAIEPMCEISPKKHHPVFHLTLLEILGGCVDKLEVKKMDIS
ncbi:2-amino-4-hydroxy-6-hydroxymethyldihydropteridine diphosphokinase [Blattabacterium cuenoti]|uniref:2-amino-4-hydroxy-6- hydroxymethyldihydropteridine diphosphokinase n=1 Tax=Blattabacterium cuenoti TaxID=1653831 RepID=UPI00163CC44F|nr:2-amino-4-hydroxy-6-hydroxymethyldihydropteridine diphosphokinase [Blattabacterium cuenoti]